MTTTVKYPGFSNTATIISGGTSTQSSIMDPTVSLRDSSGNVVNTSQVDPNTRQAIIASTLTNGAQNLTGQYNGGQGYPVTLGQPTTLHVGGSSLATAKTVTKIVAGEGIYISNPNGQGVVTISTQPIRTYISTSTLFDIAWTKQEGVPPDAATGEFLATGKDGTLMRSRDGHNWIHVVTTVTDIALGISAQYGNDIANGQVEYFAVGYSGKAYYGNAGGANGDGWSQAIQLSDQDGVINSAFVSTAVFPLITSVAEQQAGSDMVTQRPTSTAPPPNSSTFFTDDEISNGQTYIATTISRATFVSDNYFVHLTNHRPDVLPNWPYASDTTNVPKVVINYGGAVEETFYFGGPIYSPGVTTQEFSFDDTSDIRTMTNNLTIGTYTATLVYYENFTGSGVLDTVNPTKTVYYQYTVTP